MTLAELEEGSVVFVDANVFVYHFVEASPECTGLLRRCETGEVQGSPSGTSRASLPDALTWSGSLPSTKRAFRPFR
jgi:hypothetical protein